MDKETEFLFDNAKVLENEEEVETVDLGGYHVTRAELFAHSKDPAITVWHDRVKFNMAGDHSHPTAYSSTAEAHHNPAM